MKATFNYVFRLLILLAVFSVNAEQQFSFNFSGKNYFLENEVLWVTEPDNGDQFVVNTRVITVKPAAQFNSVQISHYLQQNNLKNLRTAITGYSDIQLPENADFKEALLQLENSGLFSVIEPNSHGRYLLVPDDDDYQSQWHLPQVSAEAVWDLTTGRSNIVVAVLDSGVEFTHSDLGKGSDSYGNIWINPGEDEWADPDDPNTGNNIDDDNNGFVDDWKGWDFDSDDNNGSGSFFHGTAVAGVVAAKTNNTNGVAGIAGGNNNKGASIMIGNVGNNAPNGAVLDDAILYAAANGARIIQLSLSVGSSQALDDAITLAYENYGVLIIGAAGNSSASSVGYPSSHPDIMAVGSSNQSDLKSGFSQYGDKLEISAPGSDIVTTTRNNGYVTTSGTSFSAPLTSGIASLILSNRPDLSNEQVRFILKASADKVGGYDYAHDLSKPGHSLQMGYGRVNAHSALLLSDLMGFSGIILSLIHI